MWVNRITVLISVLLITQLWNAAADGRQVDFKDCLLGRWTPDKEKTKQFTSEHEDARAFPDDVLESMPNMWLEFGEEGKAKAHIDDTPPNGESVTLEGKWEITKEHDPKNADIKVTMNVGDRDDPKSGKAELLDDDTLVISFDDEPTIVLVRTKDEEKAEDGDSSGEQKKSAGDKREEDKNQL